MNESPFPPWLQIVLAAVTSASVTMNIAFLLRDWELHRLREMVIAGERDLQAITERLERIENWREGFGHHRTGSA